MTGTPFHEHIYEPDEFQEFMAAESFKVNPIYEDLLVREAADPGYLNRNGFANSPMRLALGIYAEQKATAERYNSRTPGRTTS